MTGNKNLAESKANKDLAKLESNLLLTIKPLLNTAVESLVMDETVTKFQFAEPVDIVSTKRLKALGFTVSKHTAHLDSRLYCAMETLKKKIVKRENGSQVVGVAIDDEFANITATVDGVTNIDCGFLEDYS